MNVTGATSIRLGMDVTRRPTAVTKQECHKCGRETTPGPHLRSVRVPMVGLHYACFPGCK
jgi:hypothetical protein